MDAPTIYLTPLDSKVAAWVVTLDDDAREFFEERAAIAEYEAGMTRLEAEVAAQALTEGYMQRRDQHH